MLLTESYTQSYRHHYEKSWPEPTAHLRKLIQKNSHIGMGLVGAYRRAHHITDLQITITSAHFDWNARIDSLRFFIPLFFIGVIDGIVGTLHGLRTLIPLGEQGRKISYSKMHVHLHAFETILPILFRNILMIRSPERCLELPECDELDGFICYRHNGSTEVILEAIDEVEGLKGKYRLLHCVKGVSCIVTRTVETAIAVTALAIAVLTGGFIQSVNSVAIQALRCPGALLLDIFEHAIGAIFPDFHSNAQP